MTDVRIETERLLLRPPLQQDFERYAELYADEEAARHVGGHVPRAIAWRKFLTMAGAWSIQGFAMFSVIERAGGRWLGQLGPWKPDGWPGNEVGWAFHPDAWGAGYATEAGVAAMDWAFDRLGWEDVIHCIAPANAASKRLAARLGSGLLRSGRLPAPYDAEPTEIWGQDRAAWRARPR
ncbi:GNAT family N-acetyltransferase [Luteimonas sp. RD2P54]|uniref:GNAT family N-acetyltransferase n=1 Tax=Luteimonas endophytica TaxID=3042023 RepID=A0ABT6JC80_9GAMM|nr:GNAT family N-acetyltransferase [Luteimonas endophytica]MDH5824374.1 GNAT family N-acetyltransferase [Luteimonas endophytica]